MEEQDVRNAFWRNEDGSWICIDPVTIDHPRGRVQVSPGTMLLPGSLYMGIDLALWLEEQIRKLATPPVLNFGCAMVTIILLSLAPDIALGGSRALAVSV